MAVPHARGRLARGRGHGILSSTDGGYRVFDSANVVICANPAGVQRWLAGRLSSLIIVTGASVWSLRTRVSGHSGFNP
jgi:hypothetical protein